MEYLMFNLPIITIPVMTAIFFAILKLISLKLKSDVSTTLLVVYALCLATSITLMKETVLRIPAPFEGGENLRLLVVVMMPIVSIVATHSTNLIKNTKLETFEDEDDFEDEDE